MFYLQTDLYFSKISMTVLPYLNLFPLYNLILIVSPLVWGKYLVISRSKSYSGSGSGSGGGGGGGGGLEGGNVIVFLFYCVLSIVLNRESSIGFMR